MNSFELNFLEEAASRVWPAASPKIGLKPASVPQGNQAIPFREDNKIKAIAATDKYFLTNFAEQFGTDERYEPKAWLH